MVEEKLVEEKLIEDNERDVMEEALSLLLENGESLLSLARSLDKLSKAGLPALVEKIVSNSMPSDPQAVMKFVDNPDMLYGISKALNILPALLRSLSNESASDVIKSILYDSDEMYADMVNGAKNPNRMSFLKLMAIMKDEEVSAGMSAMLNLVKFLGKALGKVDTE